MTSFWDTENLRELINILKTRIEIDYKLQVTNMKSFTDKFNEILNHNRNELERITTLVDKNKFIVDSFLHSINIPTIPFDKKIDDPPPVKSRTIRKVITKTGINFLDVPNIKKINVKSLLIPRIRRSISTSMRKIQFREVRDSKWIDFTIPNTVYDSSIMSSIIDCLNRECNGSRIYYVHGGFKSSIKIPETTREIKIPEPAISQENDDVCEIFQLKMDKRLSSALGFGGHVEFNGESDSKGNLIIKCETIPKQEYEMYAIVSFQEIPDVSFVVESKQKLQRDILTIYPECNITRLTPIIQTIDGYEYDLQGENLTMILELEFIS